MATRRSQQDHRQMRLSDHLRELRNRFFFVAALLLTSSSLVYAFRAQIIPVILSPYKTAFGEQQLMYLNPAGGFSFIFFVSLYLGLAATIPFIVHQAYMFIRPSLPKVKKDISGRLLIGSGLLLVAGILFGYFVAVPGALTFLREFASDYVSAALTADSYMHFLVAYTVGLGLLFQIPLLLIITHFFKPLTPSGLLKSERWVILLSVIAAAIITPTPDPINMMIVAIPIIGMYQAGIIIVLIMIAKSRHQAKPKPYARLKPAQARPSTPPAVTQPKPATVHYTKLATAPPLAAEKAATSAQPKPKRSIDGLVTKGRPFAPVAIPPRETPVRAQLPAQPLRPSRQGASRYLDGVSPMYPSI